MVQNELHERPILASPKKKKKILEKWSWSLYSLEERARDSPNTEFGYILLPFCIFCHHF